MESGKPVKEKLNNEVVVVISGAEESSGLTREDGDANSSSTPEAAFSTSGNFKGSNVELSELNNQPTVHISQFTGSSPEVAKSSPNTNKPPKIPAEPVFRRRSLSKSKSRLVEPPYPTNLKNAEEKGQFLPSNSPARSSPKDIVRTAPNTPRTPVLDEEEDDDEEVYKTANLQETVKHGKKFKVLVLVELIAFVLFVGFLLACLTVDKLQQTKIWSLQIWKWCVLVIVIFCGRLITEWFVNILVFLIERNFLLKKKVLYFVYGLKKSVQAFIWLGFVLLTWSLLINHGVKRSKRTTRILNYITRALASTLIGASIWMVKTLLLKLLASSFHVNRFFDRIQESIFHQYVLQTVSGPPLMDMQERVGSTMSSQLSLRSAKNGNKREKKEVIDVAKLHRMKQEKVSAWTMKGLIKVIQSSGLSTLANTLDDDADEEDAGELKSAEITNEWEAKAAAYRIFKNVAKPNYKYIDEDDLLRFMKKEEVENVFLLFEGAAETRKIKKSSLRKWVVNVYLERKSLAHSLNDTKTAIEELNRLVSGILLIVIIIVWTILMGFATPQVLVFISSQLLLVAFMFGNTCKTVFEAIIFVFVMHPFDVGDRCVIDGVQMVVEEMNILSTVFLRYDNEKIYYPNAVLSTKPISNFYRSPEMGDSVEFSVDFSTSLESIAALKVKIKAYIESKAQHWRPGHSVMFREIEDVNKLKLGLYVTHTINFQNSGEKSSRKSELVVELKKILEELNIKYRLLPQEIQLSYVGSAASGFTPAAN